jgi:hypothetical protein
MTTSRAVPTALRNRVLAALTILAVAALGSPALAGAAPKPAVLTLKLAKVGSPGNSPVGIVPFKNAIYGSCAEAAGIKPPCQEVGGVDYRYGIGQLEVTVAQYVAFLNTVDPAGKNKDNLWSSDESSSAWPRFGQIDFSSGTGRGRHYKPAAPQWADKPYGFADFLRSARFDNSLYNGKVLTRTESTESAFSYVTYRVRLSPNSETGMYEMTKRAMTRSHQRGFVIPSQDEWIKAAYYDPKGGGKYSDWEYPTNPGAFGEEEKDLPNMATLDPSTGDVTNAASQPLAIFHTPETTPPSWCPPKFSSEECATVNPFGMDPTTYAKAFAGSLGTVGQSLTYSPWGTLDQGGNAVEWTDTITPPPFGIKGKRVWRRLHGGIANAPVYQLWLSAVRLQPQDNTFFTTTYPWLGIRIGVLGNLNAGKR